MRDTVATYDRFVGSSGSVLLFELFAPEKQSLAIYTFMFGPERERPCPGCTHFLDGMDGMTEHISRLINIVVVAKSPLSRILDFAKESHRRQLRLLSTDLRFTCACVLLAIQFAGVDANLPGARAKNSAAGWFSAIALRTSLRKAWNTLACSNCGSVRLRQNGDRSPLRH